MITDPEVLTQAASTLGVIGADISSANTAVEAPTTGIAPAAADEVSALTALQFNAHGVAFQAIAEQAAAVHAGLVSTLGENGAGYAATEAASQAGL